MIEPGQVLFITPDHRDRAPATMRIVSLLPSATEIVYALGLEDDLVGVTHECDWPPAALGKRHVSSSALPTGVSASEIDSLVSASIGDGEPIYRLDTEAIRELRPDLVISQDLCARLRRPIRICEQSCSRSSVAMPKSSPWIPARSDEVLDCVLTVAAVTGTERRAESLGPVVSQTGSRPCEWPSPASTGRTTFALEWSDPPFNGGHWVPDMIAAAGGTPVLCEVRIALATPHLGSDRLLRTGDRRLHALRLRPRSGRPRRYRPTSPLEERRHLLISVPSSVSMRPRTSPVPDLAL